MQWDKDGFRSSAGPPDSETRDSETARHSSDWETSSSDSGTIRRIQKLFSSDSETSFVGLQKLHVGFRNYFSSDSETIFVGFRKTIKTARGIRRLFSSDSETIRGIQKLFFVGFRNSIFSLDSDTIFVGFRNYIFVGFRNYSSDSETIFVGTETIFVGSWCEQSVTEKIAQARRMRF